MYQGEVNVAEEDLPNFLEVAEDLQIKEVYNSRQDHQPNFLDQNIEPSIKVKKNLWKMKALKNRTKLILLVPIVKTV